METGKKKIIDINSFNTKMNNINLKEKKIEKKKIIDINSFNS